MEELDRAIPLKIACRDFLSISPAYAYRQIADGRLKTVKNGGRTYVLESEVKRYLASLQSSTAA